MVIVLLTVGIGTLIEYRNIRQTGKQETESETAQTSESTHQESRTLLQNMGEGINIGNSLDACDWDAAAKGRKLDYQVMAVYSTDPWSAWDASDTVSVNADGTLDFTWTINSLNASRTSGCGSFAFQIINHDANAQNTDLTVSVTDAQFTAVDGQKYTLSAMNGTHSLKIKDDVTDYISQNITGMDGLQATSDVMQGTLTFSVKLQNYISDSSADVKTLETSWGNPQISEEQIEAISKEGFKTVRIPVTYFNHMSDDGTVDSEFFDRVETVVDEALDHGLYCMISIQHDTGNDGWIKASQDNYDQNQKKVAYLIRQIGERFKDKDEHLILEGFNEMVDDETKWSDVPTADLAVYNEWNQLFVDTIRATGGKNDKRFLLVNTYAASAGSEERKAFMLPDDPADHILVGVHCYTGYEDIEKTFSGLEDFTDQYPVLIGEWGLSKQNKDVSRTEYTQRFMEYAKKSNIPTVLWDDGGNYAYMNRESAGWYEQKSVDIITK